MKMEYQKLFDLSDVWLKYAIFLHVCRKPRDELIEIKKSLSQTPWNLIRGMATPKQPVSHQATPSIDQSPVSVNRARFIFSEGICL